MIEKLEDILSRFEKLEELVSSPEVIADMPVWKKYVKERAELEETALKYKEYKKTEEDMKTPRRRQTERPTEK